ncbi:NADPH-dependent F420 reductase [Lactobacillus sp.]|uniref:NADPH-dependent F420 reductase n=1 Tax=Lactobacillus sp. TaxID=1591 RepID=UPI0019A29736|nr:NADPH-dependent F420 reductase [Lactobacillus sp.]MBD5429218.1 NADPH-dependent F420 reductase [Lactobacillus sp.]
MNITIIGTGNMGKAIGKNLEMGNKVTYADVDHPATEFGDIVILAVPYGAEDAIVKQYGDMFNGKIVVDIANPLNFDTWDELVVPADSSAAAQLQEKLPNSKVLKAFNTTFAATLASGKVGDNVTTTVLIAGDDAEAKETLVKALQDSPLKTMDAGSLKRAREMEALGFLQMTLAAREQINWTGGFGVIK